MTATTPAAALVTGGPVLSDPERLALAGFLAGYSGLTCEAYALDLRQFASWCAAHSLRLFQARRANIECFGRDLEAAGRARATVTRRLCTVAGFYKYAVEEELLDHSPAAHVRRPRLDDVIDGDSALGQQLLNVPAGQAIAQVPADRDRDHLTREPETSKDRGRARRSHRTSLRPPTDRPTQQCPPGSLADPMKSQFRYRATGFEAVQAPKECTPRRSS
jgi:integrase family protein with SAM-like domain